MKISVIGASYVGLVTAACLAEKGHYVINCDIDKEKIVLLNDEIISIHEPGLEDIIENTMSTNEDEPPRLQFSDDVKESVKKSDLIYIAVGTPSMNDKLSLDYVWDAVRDVSEAMMNQKKILAIKKKILAIKSTVPIGTTNKVQEFFNEQEQPIIVVSNPEFLVEGKAVESTKRPDRIIIGTNHLNEVRKVFDPLYSPFVRREGKLLYMGPRDAELSKLGTNGALAERISFFNELAIISEAFDADIAMVREGICSDKRIGMYYSFPGPGFGGSCLPKDVPALVNQAESLGVTPYTLKAAIERNKEQKKVIPLKVIERFKDDKGMLYGKTFALWGIAFKADTDDIRESPALEVIKILSKKGANIRAYDPQANENACNYFNELISNGSLEIVSNQYYAVEGVHGLIIMTEWDSFRNPNFSRLAESMKELVVFDGRNLYERKEIAEFGFEYHSIGRKTIAI